MTGPELTGAPDTALPLLRFSQARDELVVAAERLAGLLHAVSRTAAPAVGVWSVAETAAHLKHVWSALPLLARRDLAGATRAVPAGEELGTPSGAAFPSIAALGPWTVRAVHAEPERDLGRISTIITGHAERFAAAEHDADDSPRPWIVDGVLARPVLFACHALNETLVHGDDIARANGLPWPIAPRAAALVLRCFLFEVVSQASRVAPPPCADFRLDLQLAGQDRFHVVKDATGVRLERPSGRRVDVHLRADPVSLLLLIWQRRSLPSLLARGRLLAWGRRPWRIRGLFTLLPDV